MKRYAYGLFATILAGTAQAAGYFHSADALEELRLAYDSNNPAAKAAYFRGYVAGVADSVYGNAWCPPAKVNAEQTYGIVSKYLKEHPAAASQDAAALVTVALGASFPCRDK